MPRCARRLIAARRMLGARAPVGVVLAGGRAPDRRRQGDGRAGRPAALAYAAGGRAAAPWANVAVVAKPDTALPALPGVERVDRARRSLASAGRDRARARACAGGGRCSSAPVDMPFVTPATLRRWPRARPGERAGGRWPARDGSVQPLLGRYSRRAGAAGAAGRGGAASAARPPACAPWPRRSASATVEVAPASCSTSTRPRTCAARGATAGRRDAPLAEGEVVGADAGRDCDGERVLLGAGAARPASRAAGRGP